MDEQGFKQVTVLRAGQRPLLQKQQAGCWISPDSRFAAAEFPRQTFLIGKVRENTAESCTMELLERYQSGYDPDDCLLFTSRVEWSWMKYGFFKIVSSNLESFEDCAHRFYFDEDLYYRERELLHGID